MQDDIKKPINWPELFSDYEKSGLNQKDYCEREGIKYFEFKYHRTKYLKQRSASSGFKPIRVKGTSTYELELVLPQGLCLKLKQGVPVDYVKRLLTALR